MGFTIEDMLVVSSDRYKMKLIAGSGGWSNSISWLLMLEDLTIIRNFSGKELAVTTGLGFPDEPAMLQLVRDLHAHNASGLIVNTGYYVHELPRTVCEFCDENGFPLLTVPWEIYLADMIKDLSFRLFLQSTADEQISAALISAIEHPEAKERYHDELLPYFDLDGSFQIALATTGNLDRMDTVERKRMSYRMQIYLTNLTHNGHFFYYDSCFVIVMNAMTAQQSEPILREFAERTRKRMPDRAVYIGVGDPVQDISNLHAAYRRAKAAVSYAVHEKRELQYFRDMGIRRLLYSVEDRELLRQMSEEPLLPLLEHDRLHHTEYVETLEMYLIHGGSIRAMADAMFVHRNTILYRMANIRELLGCTLEDPDDRMKYRIACMIRSMLK